MTEQPLVSILVANYNNGHYFKECYESLIKQTYNNWECVIVDDKSTDESIELINHLIKDDNRFKLFLNVDNLGVGATKKKCIELASGEICGFVDPDDAIVENALSIMIDHIIRKPNQTIYYSNFIYCDENLEPERVRKTFQVKSDNIDFYNIGGEISHLAFFYKKHYLQTEGLNEKMKRAIDQDLYLKLYDLSKGDILHINEDLYFYRIHQNGISTNNNSNKALFWHWVAILKSAERRNANMEDEFVETFIQRNEFNNIFSKLVLLKKSRLLKFLYKIGLFKAYKYL
ncbi:glycosyltransferase [Empedobacter falsenii]|uniref:glycosyltransferase family 2 protein n=1 Tax=Empedobacter stercoris TaxID=1628248 RepID=UPI001CE09384|nr:glycosyltransferase [Empedobacter stercoris]MCA4777333.1 glycosyltransferase [Empedobacter stercoris]